MINYKNKYIKYKTKYIISKKLKGGWVHSNEPLIATPPEHPPSSDSRAYIKQKNKKDKQIAELNDLVSKQNELYYDMGKCYPQSPENIVKCDKITNSIEEVTTTLNNKRKNYKLEPTMKSDWLVDIGE